ncbi:MAG: UDP-N-acetylmuramoyl-tripeptide--D-alanyl-D-alanine ligase [Betaproteobacteria bacterium]|nr:UDP-N-acetylmuramoyl-tripeptide--D-alanyl-D-alanine ligase [Betaproteobacteria bacterium]
MMRLSQAAQILGGRLLGADAEFIGVSTDSRGVARGQLFVALRGERFDGHAFLAAAAKAGASAALVDAAFDASGAPLPLIVVEDTRRALGALAAAWRAGFDPVLIAVAGSNGKTTTKEMLASILRAAAGETQVLATEGNMNNDIGLPLTLLRMRAGHRYCAIEVGMNHRGEIAQLARLAAPGIALVTNAQREHLEFMGSVEEVAEENADVFRALRADGVAVINGDDAHADAFRRAADGRRIVEFALEHGAAVSGRYTLRHLSSEIVLKCPAGEAQAVLAIPGLHNVRNALAAAACAYAAGLAPEAIGAGLTAFRPYAGRLQVKRATGGATVIDDTYNANPDSVRAAIDVLAAAHGATLLVLGDMGEVGDQGPDFHAEVGRYARERGVGALLALGESTAHSVAGYGEGARHYASVEDLIDALRRALDPGATVLVKGSRFMRMERVVGALTGDSAEVH